MNFSAAMCAPAARAAVEVSDGPAQAVGRASQNPDKAGDLARRLEELRTK